MAQSQRHLRSVIEHFAELGEIVSEAEVLVKGKVNNASVKKVNLKED
ncbi:hypothetical protein [Flavobacterium defluvii]|nr:hypothetical protein [Flavobacterium defluvii]